MPAFFVPLFALMACQSLLSLATFAVQVFAPHAGNDIGIDPNNVGIYAGVTFACTMIAALSSGMVIGRFGAFRACQGMLLLAACGMVLVTVGHMASLFLGGVLMGLAYGPNTPASSVVLATHTPEKFRNFAFSVKQSGMPMGSVLAGIIAAQIVAPIGWRYGCYLVAALCVGVAVAIEFIRPRWETGKSEGKPPSVSLKVIFGNIKKLMSAPVLRVLVLVSQTFMCMQFALGNFLVDYLTRDVGIPFAQASWLYTIAHIAGVGGRPIFGIVADRLVPPVRLLGLLGVLMAVAGTATAFLDAENAYWYVMAIGLLFGGTASGWNGVMLSEVARFAGKDTAAIMGAFAFMSFGTVTVSPLIFALLYNLTNSYPYPFLLYSMTAAAAGVCLLLLHVGRAHVSRG